MDFGKQSSRFLSKQEARPGPGEQERREGRGEPPPRWQNKRAKRANSTRHPTTHHTGEYDPKAMAELGFKADPKSAFMGHERFRNGSLSQDGLDVGALLVACVCVIIRRVAPAVCEHPLIHMDRHHLNAHEKTKAPAL